MSAKHGDHVTRNVKTLMVTTHVAVTQGTYWTARNPADQPLPVRFLCIALNFFLMQRKEWTQYLFGAFLLVMYIYKPDGEKVNNKCDRFYWFLSTCTYIKKCDMEWIWVFFYNFTNVSKECYHWLMIESIWEISNNVKETAYCLYILHIGTVKRTQ